MSEYVNKEELIKRIMKAPQERVWTVDEIKKLLQTSPKAVYNGILAIYKLQTSDEKSSKDTVHRNNVGFNSADGHLLSSFAEQILAGKTLSPKQFSIAYNRILKYAGQLTDIANNNYDK